MTRKFFTLVGFVFLALVLIYAMKSKNRLRRAGNSQDATIVTQDGNLTVVQPESRAKMMLVAPLPKTNQTTSSNAIPGSK